MYCENKNNLLDLYFLEGSDSHLSQIREHVQKCNECQEYLNTLKTTMDVLDKVEEINPSLKVFENILAEVSTSIPKPVLQKQGVPVIPILQIAFGQIFLLAIIYILNLKLTLSPFWNSIKDNWIVQSFGAFGIAFLVVVCIGTFITLALAPVLLFEAKERKSFVN